MASIAPGHRYGYWTVVKQAERRRGETRWHCRCDCGTERVVLRSSLIGPASPGCGCARRAHMVPIHPGDQFVHWTATGLAERRKGEEFWECQCDCGARGTISAARLRSGTARSCGCGNVRKNTISAVMRRLVVQEDGCCTWPGSLTSDGYGNVGWHGRIRPVHRLLYEHFVGPVPKGHELDHICRRRNCANFAHLEPVPHAVNVQRGASGTLQVRRTHCPRGHPYSADNAHVDKRGARHCRECGRQRCRTRYYALKARGEKWHKPGSQSKKGRSDAPS